MVLTYITQTALAYAPEVATATIGNGTLGEFLASAFISAIVILGALFYVMRVKPPNDTRCNEYETIEEN
jgi:hypothetical protein